MQRLCTSILHAIILLIAGAVPISMALAPQIAIASILWREPVLAPAQSYTISGTVRNYDNTPVQGGLVSTGWGDPDIAMATTDAQGKYTLTVMAPGTYHIGVSFFYNKLDPAPQTVTIPPSQTSVDFTFSQYDSIRGTVRDADGLPVAGATVTTNYTDPLYTSTVTDAGGAYTLAVTAGIYYVSASKYGYGSPPAQRIIVPPSRTDVDFAFFVPYTIQGTVRTFAGEPVSGASVSTAEDDPVRAFAMTDSEFNGLYNSGLSDGDGWYSLIVAAGTYTITAFHSNFAAPPTQVVTIPPERDDINFVLSPLPPPDQYIQGIVIDDTGQPAANAVVSLAELPPGTKTVYYNGAFSKVVYPGTYTVAAGGAGYVTSPSQQITVPPSRTDLTFTVRRADQFIFGEVTDEEGNPLCSIKVEATGEAASGAVLTDNSGRFAFRVPGSAYTIRALALYQDLLHFSPLSPTNRVTLTAFMVR